MSESQKQTIIVAASMAALLIGILGYQLGCTSPSAQPAPIIQVHPPVAAPVEPQKKAVAVPIQIPSWEPLVNDKQVADGTCYREAVKYIETTFNGARVLDLGNSPDDVLKEYDGYYVLLTWDYGKKSNLSPTMTRWVQMLWDGKVWKCRGPVSDEQLKKRIEVSSARMTN